MNEAYDPRHMGGVLQRAIEEILGADELRSLLESAGLGAETKGKSAGEEFIEGGRFSTARLHDVLAALEQKYGGPAGRGLSLRIGRACFAYGLREYGDVLGVTSTSFRLLPFPSKVKTFAASLAEMFNSFAAGCVHVEEGDGKLRWHMENCPFCRGQRAEQGICSLPAGLAEEALYWLSGGKMFNVEEIACIARGDSTCVVQVDEMPLDS